MVRHRPRCRDVLPLLKLWPNEPKSVHLEILDRRSNISNRRLSCETMLASWQENVTDGTALWGYGLVKSTSYSHTSQSHSCCGSCSYTIWSIFDEANLFSEMELLGFFRLPHLSRCQSDKERAENDATGTALHNYSHSGLPQLICAWTPHPTILPILGLSRQVWNPKAWQKSDDKPWYTLLQLQVAYLLATSCAVPCCDSLQPKQYRKPKPDAWVVCNEAGQAVFGNFRPWNLQQVLVPTVTSAEGEGFFGSRSFLRSMIHRTEPFSFYMFLAVRGFFRMICLIHNLPNTCLVGFKSLFHGSTFPVEEQVWKWGGASCFHSDKSPVAASSVLPHEEDMSL